MRIRRPQFISALVAASAVVVAGCAGAPAAPAAQSAASFSPVTLTSCGISSTITAPPTKAVTLNQGATEVMLALGLEDRMAGTAYLDDAVPKRWQQAYSKVTVLSKKYPTKEAFLATQPDFAYASYASAFTDKDGVGAREELTKEKITTYLSPLGCPKGVTRAPSTMDSVWGEVSDVAKAFGVSDRADTFVTEQKSTLASLTRTAAGKGKKVLWYDSGDKAPVVGAGKGGPQIILDSVGATNIFADLAGGWGTGTWEKVVAADPDVIVLADASWDPAKKKQDYLQADPVLSKLTAVKNQAFIIVPFSESTPGIRLVDGAAKVSEQMSQRR